MPDHEQAEPMATPDARERGEQAERWELLGHLQNLLEPVMVALGLALLVMPRLERGIHYEA